MNVKWIPLFRLLPLLDDLFAIDELEFSSRKIYRFSDCFSSDDSAEDCSRRSFSADIDGVGFYLSSGSPPRTRSSSAKMKANCWTPYFGDPKGESTTEQGWLRYRFKSV